MDCFLLCTSLWWDFTGQVRERERQREIWGSREEWKCFRKGGVARKIICPLTNLSPFHTSMQVFTTTGRFSASNKTGGKKVGGVLRFGTRPDFSCTLNEPRIKARRPAVLRDDLHVERGPKENMCKQSRFEILTEHEMRNTEKMSWATGRKREGGWKHDERSWLLLSLTQCLHTTSGIRATRSARLTFYTFIHHELNLLNVPRSISRSRLLISLANLPNLLLLHDPLTHTGTTVANKSQGLLRKQCDMYTHRGSCVDLNPV